MAAGAARVYVQELSSIRRLSEAGSAQLAADLDYFCNVLAALGVALPPQLVTWQVRPLPCCSCLCVSVAHMNAAPSNTAHTVHKLHSQEYNVSYPVLEDRMQKCIPNQKRLAQDVVPQLIR